MAMCMRQPHKRRESLHVCVVSPPQFRGWRKGERKFVNLVQAQEQDENVQQGSLLYEDTTSNLSKAHEMRESL